MPQNKPSRAALRLVVASTVLVGAAYASAFLGERGSRIGAWLMALGSSGLVASTMALGALRSRADARRLTPLFVATFVVIFASLAAALLLPPDEGPSSTIVLGLPLRAAIVVYGIGIVPLLALPLAYALTFDESRLDPERIRSRARELAAESASGGDVPSA